jgi:Protein of unknown function (DUF1592)/Protein of unknown function (DUF1595)/Protein of unknown function (DUF1588)/Protein of unknown function (DUF1585)
MEANCPSLCARPGRKLLVVMAAWVLLAPACSGNVEDPGGAPNGTSTGGAGGSGGAGSAGTSGAVTCAPLDPVPPRLWRLSAQQYSNSIRDLLGLATAPDLGTLGGQATFAFFSDETLSVDPQLAYNINATLQQVLPTVNFAQRAACQTGEAQDACAQRFAQSFGQRAFRRPLDSSEVQGLMTAYHVGSQQDFNAGLGVMALALLQSPSFIFRSELGSASSGATAPTTLGPYEIATQLAYTFLDSAPDDPLLAAAASGGLDTPAGVNAQIDRLLALPSAKANIDRITLNWFNVPQLYAKQKDASLLAPLNPTSANTATLITDLQNDAFHSASLFVDDLLWQGSGKVVDLLTSDKLFVNQRLATLLGLPFTGATPDTFVGVSAGAQGRAGMLTQPGALWAVSDVASTSIVHRGIGIHDNVVCADPIPFPAGLINSPDIVAALAARPTEIEKSDYRLKENPVCLGCHGNIDPYGRVLEGFDPVGNTRTIADGLPVDQVADFSNAPPLSGTLNGPVQLAQAIIADHQFTQCAAQMISSYALGRMIHVNATCEVQAMRQQFDASDGKISTLFRYVMTAGFAHTRAGGSP